MLDKVFIIFQCFFFQSFVSFIQKVIKEIESINLKLCEGLIKIEPFSKKLKLNQKTDLLLNCFLLIFGLGGLC